MKCVTKSKIERVIIKPNLKIVSFTIVTLSKMAEIERQITIKHHYTVYHQVPPWGLKIDVIKQCFNVNKL